MSRGGSGNPDCQDIYKQAKPIISNLSSSIVALEKCLEGIVEQRTRHPISGNHRNDIQNADIPSVMKKTEDAIKTSRPLIEKFRSLAQMESSCSASMFFRARHSVGEIEKKRLICYALLSKILLGQLSLYARQDLSKAREDLITLFTMADTYNQLLKQDVSIPQSGPPARSVNLLTVLHYNRHYHSHIQDNFCSPLNHQLKPITASKLLGVVARERAKLTTVQFSTSLLEDVDRQELEHIAADLKWMEINVPFKGIDQELSGGIAAAGEKNKDGDGTKRKNKKSSASPGPNDSGAIFVADTKTHFTTVEQIVDNESVFLHQILSALPQVTGLVNKNQLKEGKDGTKRLNGHMRKKMGEFYHDILWRHTGQLIEEPLLWEGSRDRLPMGLVHPRVALAYHSMLKDFSAAQIGEAYPSLILPSIHITLETMNLHVISASWDLQFLRSLAVSSRLKSQRIIQDDLSLATLAGSLFKVAINSLVHLNNRCLPDIMTDIVCHGSHDPEEYPFLEEIHILRRLQATLFAIRNWVEARSSAYLQSWRVTDFFVINHADLARILPSFDLLQICDHERVSTTNSASIKLFTHVQKAIAQIVKSCQSNIKSLPTNQNENMCRVCRTFCLACLQNIFPGPRHWTKSGASSSTYSSYVKDYIERILQPVFMALTSFPNEVQQSVGRLAVKTLCDCWLEHIYQKKIKFSEQGAKQLGKDFAFLREWIGSTTHLMEESKRYLLLLDSIRQCEGVAQLLQSSSGKEVPVKPNRSNKVAPTENGCEEAPVNHILEAIPPELYVTNHKKWLSLRAGGGGMSMPFCC